MKPGKNPIHPVDPVKKKIFKQNPFHLLVVDLGGNVASKNPHKENSHLLTALVAVGGFVRADVARDALAPDQLGGYTGWARMVDDPQPYQSSTRAILEVEGERFEMWSRGRAQQLRVRDWDEQGRLVEAAAVAKQPPKPLGCR